MFIKNSKKFILVTLVSATALIASQSHTPIKSFENSFKKEFKNAVLKSAIVHSAQKEGWKISKVDAGSLMLEKPYTAKRMLSRSISKVPRYVSTTHMIKAHINYTPKDIAFSTNLNKSDGLYSNVKMLKSSIHKELAKLSKAVSGNQFEKILLSKVKAQGWEIVDIATNALKVKKTYTKTVTKRLAHSKVPRRSVQVSEVVASVAFDKHHITSVKADNNVALAFQEMLAADLHALKDSVHIEKVYALR